MENRFIVGPAVSGNSFFGRKELVRELGDVIFGGGGARNIVGPTRIGKSSLVKEVFEKNKAYPSRICIQLQMGKFQSAYAFWWTLARHIQDGVKAAGLWDERFEDYYQELRDYVDPQKAEWFTDLQFPLESILEAIGECGYRVVLAIDEFDSVERLFGQDSYYYQELRDIFSDARYATGGVLISRRRLQMFEATCPYISTFHGVFPEITLLPFSEKDMEEFYAAFEECDIRLSSGGKKRLARYTGNMPYLCCMFANRMVNRSNEFLCWGDREIDAVFKELMPQIDRHYEDLIVRLEEDDHIQFVFYLSVGMRIPNFTQRDIENMTTMGILFREERDGEVTHYAFSKDFMTYFSLCPLKLPAWETMTASEKKLKEILKKEYPDLERVTYQDLCGSNGETVKRNLSAAIPEINFNWPTLMKYAADLSTHKSNPVVLDVLTLSVVINTMVNEWDTRFSRHFGGDAEWKNKLSVIKTVRNPIAHAQSEHLSEQELAICMQYCDEVIRLPG